MNVQEKYGSGEYQEVYHSPGKVAWALLLAIAIVRLLSRSGSRAHTAYGLQLTDH